MTEGDSKSVTRTTAILIRSLPLLRSVGSQRPYTYHRLHRQYHTAKVDFKDELKTKSVMATENSELIDELLALSKRSPKLVKSAEAEVPGSEDIVVRSWKMNEFKYYDVPSPFPTLARGLFTTDVTDQGPTVKHKIVIRGYDKFFNIGEVPWTTWAALKEHTAAPYVLSLKSNGCIIFIAAITPQKLIVTSKHSVGSGGESVSHAAKGRSWLNKYLVKKGRTEADLAAVLWENQWTAVAELCDDSFEEHVLPYSPEKTGLHLHGLNLCSKAFHTLPNTLVDAFADEWGFIRTASVTLDTLEEVRTFTDHTGSTGVWNGEAVEGFVVRTHIAKPQAQTPYTKGSTFFFKVKFDEPYMMYRDWREVTKNLLSMKGKGVKMSAKSLSKGKMRRKETQEYVAWVIHDIERHPELYREYAKGKGIIATRERFLKFMAGGGVPGQEQEGEEGGEKVFGKTVIVPVAIPGCGKTSVSLALAHLFGWGHTQSDNVQAKKPGPIFIKNVVNLLQDYDVVIADKNNHLKQHRQALRDATANSNPPVRLLALNWNVHDKPPALVHRICSSRIVKRGDRHQTLRPDATATTTPTPVAGARQGAKGAGKGKGKGGKVEGHESVVWMFINTGEELVLDEVDEVVDMPIEDDAEASPVEPGTASAEDVEAAAAAAAAEGLKAQIWRAVEGVCKILDLEIPSEERIEEALTFVREYEDGVGVAKTGGPGSDKKAEKKAKGQQAKKEGTSAKSKAPIRYYGILPEVDLAKVIDGVVSSPPSTVSPQTLLNFSTFYGQLKSSHRIASRPHITIVHKNELKASGHEVTSESLLQTQELWEGCKEVYESGAGEAGAGEGRVVWEGVLERLIWDGRVLAFTVEDIGVQGVSLTSTTRGNQDDEDEDEDSLQAPTQSSQLSISAHTGPSRTALRTAQHVLERVSEGRRKRLHVTVGTRDGSVPAVEGKVLVEAYRRACEAQGVSGVDGEVLLEGGKKAWSLPVEGGVKVKGLLKGLMG